jgi:hypothetical protein
MKSKWIRVLLIVVLCLFIIVIGMQFIPVDRANPSVTREIQWDSPETRALAQRACFDCHSNETTWPWYSKIAPVSFLVAGHVKEGRESLNFSTWDQASVDIDEIQEVISEGEMPLSDYLLMHPSARLTDAEKQQLISGLQKTIQQDPAK